MEKRLQRDDREKMIGGVCAGLAEYFGIDVSFVRIAFVVAVMFGAGVLAYIILWIVMPPKPFDPTYSRYNADYKVYDNSTSFANPGSGPSYVAPPIPPLKNRRRDGNGKVIAGLLFIFFGTYFMLDEFDVVPYWFELDKLWPLIFIIPGLMLLSKSQKKPWEEDPVVDPMQSSDAVQKPGSTVQDPAPVEPVDPAASAPASDRPEDKL